MEVLLRVPITHQPNSTATRRIASVDRIILAIGKHIGAEDAADIGCGEGIRAYKSSSFGVVIAGVQVIQPRIAVNILYQHHGLKSKLLVKLVFDDQIVNLFADK